MILTYLEQAEKVLRRGDGCPSDFPRGCSDCFIWNIFKISCNAINSKSYALKYFKNKFRYKKLKEAL